MLTLFLAQIKIAHSARSSALTNCGCSSPSQPIGRRVAKILAVRPGTQTGQRVGLEAHARCFAGERKQRRHIGLHIVEVDRLARTRPTAPASARRWRRRRAFRSRASPPFCTSNFLPISNSRTRGCCRRRFSRHARMRPLHSDTRISLKSAEIGFASAQRRRVREIIGAAPPDRRSCR